MPERPFEGSVVVVTGGAAGIGKAVAQAFVEAGSAVAVLDRDLSGAPDGVTAMKADVTSDAEVNSAHKRPVYEALAAEIKKTQKQ